MILETVTLLKGFLGHSTACFLNKDWFQTGNWQSVNALTFCHFNENEWRLLFFVFIFWVRVCLRANIDFLSGSLVTFVEYTWQSFHARAYLGNGLDSSKPLQPLLTRKSHPGMSFTNLKTISSELFHFCKMGELGWNCGGRGRTHSLQG